MHIQYLPFAVTAFLLMGTPPMWGQQGVPPPPTRSQQQVLDDEAFLKGAYLTSAVGVQAPKLISKVNPNYTPAAIRQKIAGEVRLQIVIGIDGRVDRARVVASLDKTYGLDASAMEAVRQWRFQPGTVDGIPVPVAVDVDLAFKFHPCSPPSCDPVISQSVAAGDGSNEYNSFLMGAYLVGINGVRPPTVVKEVKPSYTPEAMRQKIHGVVEVQAVVGIDGRVVRARVTKSLDKEYGLDAAALATAEQWKFKPGNFNGNAVPVAVVLRLEFRLRQ